MPAAVQLWTALDVAAFVRSISAGGAQQTCPQKCPLVLALNASRFEQRGVTGQQLEALFAAFAAMENATHAEARAEAAALAAEGGGGGLDRSVNKLRPNASKKVDAKLRLFATSELRDLLPEGEPAEQVALQVLVRLRDALAHRARRENSTT